MPLSTDMEEQRLNLDRPLLSARRYVGPPTTCNERKKIDNGSLPRFHSQLKSGPIRNGGAVPFVWEHSPGQPKQQTVVKPPTEHYLTAPKLPPGRFPKANNYDNNVNIDMNLHNNKQLAVNENFREVDERSKDRKEEDEEEEEEEDDSEEAYVDALNTLSRTEESFSLSCSRSGPDENREFMMDRFLPAAKAMVSLETPRYVLTEKQQPLVTARSQRPVYREMPTLRYGPSFAKQYSNYQEEVNREEEEEEDDERDNEYGQRQNLCGLLPGLFCLRGNIHSACLVNPVSANKAQQHRLASSSKLNGGEARSRRKEFMSGFESHCASTQIHTIPQVKIKGLETFEEPMAGLGSSEESSSVIEKTLHVDTVTHKLGSTDSGSFLGNAAHSIQRTDKTNSDEACKKSSSMGFLESRAFLDPDSSGGEITQEATKGETEVLEKHTSISIAHLLSPPLPKSPSDSWLCRTLPSLSTKNSSTLYRERFFKTPTGDDIKWETIVRTTKPRNRHIMRIQRNH